MGLFSHKATLGFWLQEDGLEAALIWPKRKGWKVAGQALSDEGGLLTASDRRDRLGRAFRHCVRKLPRSARRADLCTMLAVPDTVVEEEVLRFAEFPTSKKEAQALVAHRMAREMAVSVDDITVAWEAFPAEAGHACRARAMNRSLRADIEAAASANGFRLTRIDGWTAYASAAPEFRDLPNGAAVWSDGSAWSLLCWAGSDPIGFCQQGDYGMGSAGDVVRMSQSYARAQGVERLDLVMDVPGEVSEALSAHARAAGVALRRFATEATRAERVAAWG